MLLLPLKPANQASFIHAITETDRNETENRENRNIHPRLHNLTLIVAKVLPPNRNYLMHQRVD